MSVKLNVFFQKSRNESHQLSAVVPRRCSSPLQSGRANKAAESRRNHEMCVKVAARMRTVLNIEVTNALIQKADLPR